MRKSAGHCWCIFPVDCFPCRKTGSQWDIKGKAKPKQCYMFVLLPACVRVCVSASVCLCVFVRCHIDTSQLSSISSHNPSKQAAIHPWSHASIYLSMQLPVRASHVVGLNYNVSCHARIFARSLCRCKEFNMCFD